MMIDDTYIGTYLCIEVELGLLNHEFYFPVPPPLIYAKSQTLYKEKVKISWIFLYDAKCR